jgi:hypothetical protein
MARGRIVSSKRALLMSIQRSPPKEVYPGDAKYDKFREKERLDVPPLNALDLQVLVAIAQHGHLVAAAEWLKVSPSALSRTVTRVEKSSG